MRLFITIALSLLSLNAFAQSCGQQGEEQSILTREVVRDIQVVHNVSPSVPEYVVFAGDTIRFDTEEKYERMDRELITFSYMHTNSTLMLKRSERIFSKVVPILKERGLPEDLKYLMAIESNLDPKALSSAKAAGLWQFMKGTATQYGLEVTEEVDERYHIEKETVAACKFLKESYARYHEWMTVAASYNAGQAGISKRLADQHQDSAMDLWMFEETTRYMYRILACKMMFENPEAFGFDVKDRYPVIPDKKVVEVSSSDVDLVKLAEDNGVTYAELKRANLWLRGSKLTNKAGKTYKVVIPGRLTSDR